MSPILRIFLRFPGLIMGIEIRPYFKGTTISARHVHREKLSSRLGAAVSRRIIVSGVWNEPRFAYAFMCLAAHPELHLRLSSVTDRPHCSATGKSSMCRRSASRLNLSIVVFLTYEKGVLARTVFRPSLNSSTAQFLHIENLFFTEFLMIWSFLGLLLA